MLLNNRGIVWSFDLKSPARWCVLSFSRIIQCLYCITDGMIRQFEGRSPASAELLCEEVALFADGALEWFIITGVFEPF